MTTEQLIGTILLSPLAGIGGLFMFLMIAGLFTTKIEITGLGVVILVTIGALAFIGSRLLQ